jgi:hypothetical protein
MALGIPAGVSPLRGDLIWQAQLWEWFAGSSLDAFTLSEQQQAGAVSFRQHDSPEREAAQVDSGIARAKPRRKISS